MAWKNHEQPATKVCTECKRELPYDRKHYHIAVKRHTRADGTVTVRYYAQGKCKECKLAWMRDMDAIDAALAGRKRRKVPEHLLAEAVALVRSGQASRRGAAKLVGINHQAVRVAVKEGRQFPRQPRLWADPVRQAISRGCIERDISIQELCAQIGVTDRVLRPFTDDRPDTISVVTADKLLTALGLHHLMVDLEGNYLVED